MIKRILSGPGRLVLARADDAETTDIALVDLLLIEVSPTLDGRAHAEQLRERKPDLPVVYVTAWHGHPDFADLKPENALRVPFTREELTSAVDTTLRRKGRS